MGANRRELGDDGIDVSVFGLHREMVRLHEPATAAQEERERSSRLVAGGVGRRRTMVVRR